jgi:hypothetical protein
MDFFIQGKIQQANPGQVGKEGEFLQQRKGYLQVGDIIEGIVHHNQDDVHNAHPE